MPLPHSTDQPWIQPGPGSGLHNASATRCR